MYFKRWFVFLFVLAFSYNSCSDRDFNFTSGSNSGNNREYGGYKSTFKIPLPKGYDWEVTQSWEEHCSDCNRKYNDWDYCSNSMSHTWNCCKFAWDFNLPGNADKGKPVLASADGRVKKINDSNGWGYYVVIDHGDNLCTRYAHLLPGSTEHLSVGQHVCQGLILGEIGKSGDSEGYHLHFHFENCDEGGISIPHSFTDGNNIPVCMRGNDVYDEYGNYSALILSNELKWDCDEGSVLFNGGVLPKNGWLEAECGDLPACPMIPNCNRVSDYKFSDDSSLSELVRPAAAYLFSECALDGKSDRGLHPHDNLTRAEALKIPMFLFGLMGNCGMSEPFSDVHLGDWFYKTVVCAVKHGIIDSSKTLFHPNEEANFVEAAKMVVEAASKWGVIDIKNPGVGNFKYIPHSHWGYKYVETLYSYGGLNDNHTDYRPDRSIERGDYVVMVASVSPCYCPNIICESGCVCDQAYFSCIDLDDHSSGTGGQDSPPEPEPYDPPDPPEPEPEPREPEPEPWEPEPEPVNPGAWSCDPEVGYTVYLYSPGSFLDIVTSAPDTLQQQMPSDHGVNVVFECNDLPAAMLVDAVGEIILMVEEDGRPPIAVWENYEDNLMITPSKPFDQMTFEFLSGPQRILVRVPAL